ncbi:hypothetical protein HNQ81_000070 [Desulfoprunum benzoelyticum]|uniref:Transposase IS4-like domain-containing protein n=1 Tax=Desulfoprunum benzoelyticum TaxID=1506996 RepID=A0A840UP81_9BACT|nr:hypothetical protein [Desulfoprunum benzoelyticum]
MELQVPCHRRPPFRGLFATFAAGNLGNVVHALVAEYLSQELVGHISRYSTAIVGREKPAKKAAKEPKPPRKRGRPAKGKQRETATLKRLDRQVHQTAEEAIGEQPTICDRGTKQNAKGYKTSWNGYKLHLDTNDIGLPISVLVTSVSLHDSQVAIPLIKMTSEKVTYLYDLMDAAYDAHLIEKTSRKFGHVPIADRNGRGKEVVPMAPHEAERYKIRSCAERANSRLKEDFGWRPDRMSKIKESSLHPTWSAVHFARGSIITRKRTLQTHSYDFVDKNVNTGLVSVRCSLKTPMELSAQDGEIIASGGGDQAEGKRGGFDFEDVTLAHIPGRLPINDNFGPGAV